MTATMHAAGRILRRGARAALESFERALGERLGIITSVQTDRAVFALTFDDGPHPEYTPAVLDILARHEARATFFMVGELAEKHPALVRAAARAGHSIGNHSWSHLSFPLLAARERRRQLERCQDALAPYGEMLFRPPYCHQSVGGQLQALNAGYRVIGFSAHAEDWLDRSSEWMALRLEQRARMGSIFILHDNIYRSVLPAARRDRRAMLAALDRFLGAMKGKFRSVTVSELLRQGRARGNLRYQRGPEELEPALRRHLLEADES